MNIRSLTRGDGVVIGAAVLLFIASFLDTYNCDGDLCGGFTNPNAWQDVALLMGLYIIGILGAALIVVSRALKPQNGQPRRVGGLELGQLGITLTLFSAWIAFWTIIDPLGGSDDAAAAVLGAGGGLILGLIAALILAAAALASSLVPALKAPLLPASRPQGPQSGPLGTPYGGQPGQQHGYGYPGQQGQQGQQQGPYGGQPQGTQGYGYPGQQGQPGAHGPEQHGQQGHQQAPAQAPAEQHAAPAADFSPFWFAVPVARPLYGEDGAPTPIAELAPGTWYLAVEQRGPALIAQTQDGRRGVLQDTTGIQRG
ncbi:hypothetical protein [Streptomyces sp. NPDC060194]|uniref:hypothetical protein n=1 Tax=Streptomyces sp. NPDC060194 TaxID=3347069 RepID=UPI00365FF837